MSDTSSLKFLPEEVLYQIFGLLSLGEALCLIGQTNHHFNQLIATAPRDQIILERCLLDAAAITQLASMPCPQHVDFSGSIGFDAALARQLLCTSMPATVPTSASSPLPQDSKSAQTQAGWCAQTKLQVLELTGKAFLGVMYHYHTKPLSSQSSLSCIICIYI